MPQRICLNMIVKDEAHVIRRCLDSVRPYIDCYLIADTGSTDGTPDLIRHLLADLPGEVVERPWKDFGHNRTEALALARDRAEFTLTIDADEVFEAPRGFRWPALTADAYSLRHRVEPSGTEFDAIKLVRAALPWRYVGVLHEVIACDALHRAETLRGPVVRGLFDSARNRGDPVEKYRRDAAVLEAALKDEPDDARYVFYLAQSYRDAGDTESALATYARRARMGGWEEEVWYSLYQIGLLKEKAGRDTEEAMLALLEAYQFRPARAETLVQLARLLREAGWAAAAYPFASAAVKTPLPGDALFLDPGMYGWRALDELAVAAYHAGHVRESLVVADQLVRRADLPAGERERVAKNRQLAVAALGHAQAGAATPAVALLSRKERRAQRR
ncbi:MAG: glycosyltransferase [Betaproteobacteria bacterium]